MTIIKTYPERTPRVKPYALESRRLRNGIPATDWYTMSTYWFAWRPRLAILVGAYVREGFEYRIVRVKRQGD